MYTATIKKKELVNGALLVTVLFSDGVTDVTDSCVPQDLNGLKFWIKSRLATLNGAVDIDTTFAVDDVVDVKEPVVEEPVLTAQEIAKETWFKNYRKWIKVKTTLIDTGVLTGNETKVLALQNKVKTDFLPAYIDSI